jgi:hypothetical protein
VRGWDAGNIFLVKSESEKYVEASLSRSKEFEIKRYPKVLQPEA